MLDFTSSRYLGLKHEIETLRPWPEFTTGAPAAVVTPPLALRVAGGLAGLIGVERAILARSTFHAFWDFFGMPSHRGRPIFVDDGAYPISRWGIGRAGCLGSVVRPFRHHDAGRLYHLVSQVGPHARPIIVTDGLCAGCGSPAPLSAYLDVAREFDGLLVVDDTQALGILGVAPTSERPFGMGGGGSLRWHGAGAANALVIASLAKGLSVPLAVIAGSASLIRQIEEGGDTRIHCSPPSNADLSAAEHALNVNSLRGDLLRDRLCGLVRRFRRGLRQAGFAPCPFPFPVQSVDVGSSEGAGALYKGLLRRHVRAVLHRPACRPQAVVSLLLAAHHSVTDVDRALAALEAATAVRVSE